MWSSTPQVHELGSAAQRVKNGVLAIGDSFGQSREFGEVVDRLRIGFWPTDFAGRSGVMGDVDPETVAAVFGFFSPDFVSRCLRDSAVAGTPSQLAREDRSAMDRWGRRVLDGLPNVERAAATAERIVSDADPTALPMFAAMRSHSNDRGDGHSRAVGRSLQNVLSESPEQAFWPGQRTQWRPCAETSPFCEGWNRLPRSMRSRPVPVNTSARSAASVPRRPPPKRSSNLRWRRSRPPPPNCSTISRPANSHRPRCPRCVAMAESRKQRRENQKS